LTYNVQFTSFVFAQFIEVYRSQISTECKTFVLHKKLMDRKLLRDHVIVLESL